MAEVLPLGARRADESIDVGYAVYFVNDTQRWQGYAVPGICDKPDCAKEIDYGLGYKCEDDDCWLCFCTEHSDLNQHKKKHDKIQPKPNILKWRRWMLYHESWEEWRSENPVAVQNIISKLNGNRPADERTVLLHIKRDENDNPYPGNTIILLNGEDTESYVQAGWTVVETHFPSWEDERKISHELLDIVKEQTLEMLEDSFRYTLPV